MSNKDLSVLRKEKEQVTYAQPKIEIKGIKKSFGQGSKKLPVIEGISLDISPGEFVSIVGPSGCGKSTLMSILAGFDQPDEGSVQVDGQVRKGANPKGILISQQGTVFPWMTVQQNMLFGLTNGTHEEKLALSDKYISLVGLKGFEKSYPHELSGGMLKRVEIARALAMKPEILFMDEPFSALDALMSLKIRNELLKILSEEKVTVVLITHDIEEAVHLSDKIYVLSPRPTSVQSVFEVPIPHPRRITNTLFQSIKEKILTALGM